MIGLALPAAPPAQPPLNADPGVIVQTADQVLAAAAQLDDAAGATAELCQLGGWQGRSADAYAAAVAPTRRATGAASLALRGLGYRIHRHARVLRRLIERRTGLEAARETLADHLDRLRLRAIDAPPASRPALEREAALLRQQVGVHLCAVGEWQAEVEAEEHAMIVAFTSIPGVDRATVVLAGRDDPADTALRLLATMVGPDDPDSAWRWWSALSPLQRRAIVVAAPGAVGDLDGLPAHWRDAANTVALDRDLGSWTLDPGSLSAEAARQLATALATRAAVRGISRRVDPETGRPVSSQLYLYDPGAFDGDGRVAVSAGDLDHADHVAVLVPGFGTDADGIEGNTAQASILTSAARFMAPGATTATLAWVGYDAPDNAVLGTGPDHDALGVGTESLARHGGDALAPTIDGLRASRSADPAHLTVIGHSYGSTTVGSAAGEHGLAADDLVFVGSPGVGGDNEHATDLGADPEHVWAGVNTRDLVPRLANHGIVHLDLLGGAGMGDDPAEDDFGGQRFQAESEERGMTRSFDQHRTYFDPDTESLANISRIVVGDYDHVTRAGHITDPWIGPPKDPENSRTPTTPLTGPR